MVEQIVGDPTKAGELAQEIVAVLINEDFDTRRRAIRAAIVLLGDAESSGALAQVAFGSDTCVAHEDPSLGTFFNREGSLRPAESAQLCAAFHFSLHGNAPFSLAELRDIAREAGVVLPDRLDMTVSQASMKGKKLFQSAGKGLYRPTAAAGLMFAERWGVKPGKNSKKTPVGHENGA
jgi:hypothetical protein